MPSATLTTSSSRPLEVPLPSWARSGLIGLVAAVVLAITWLVCEELFRVPADRSIAITSLFAVVVAMILGPRVASGATDNHNSSANFTPGVLAASELLLRAKVTSSTSEQVNALTDRGILAVPWTVSATSAITTDAVSGLADYVSSGGQLVILGDSQSGKTTLATRLASLLSTSAGRQPIVFSLSTWPIGASSIKRWMLDTIKFNYALNRPEEIEAAELALANRRIIPIFDGLDEIDENLRSNAARAIHLLVGDGPAVLTSVPTAHIERDARLALSKAEVVTLDAVAATEVGRYLLEGNSDRSSKWDALVAAITASPSSELSTALSSPLIAWLAKTIYAGDSDDAQLNENADPTELLDADRFPDSDAIERFLLGQLARAIFRRDEASPTVTRTALNTFRIEDIQHWLSFIASHAMRRIVAFWEFSRYAPLYRISSLLAIVVGVGLAFGQQAITDFTFPAYLLLIAGCIFGFGWSRGYSATRAKADDRTRMGYGYADQYQVQKDGTLREHATKLVKALSLVVIAYASTMTVELIVLRGDIAWFSGLTSFQILTGLLFAIVLCFGVSYLGGRLAAITLLKHPAIDAGMGARTGDPLRVIANDRRSGLVVYLISLITLSAGDAVYRALFLPASSIWWLATPPLSALIVISMWNVWVRFKAAHIWLVLRGQLPWPLVPFLTECHDGGIFRKNGNYFEFRHKSLQEALKNTE